MDYSGEDHPLDLSKKSPINISSLNPLSGSISSSLSMTPIYDKPLKRRRVHIVEKLNETESNRCEPQKRLLCDCGVSFLAEETLNGHKKYYCRNRTHNEEEFPKVLFFFSLRFFYKEFVATKVFDRVVLLTFFFRNRKCS